MLVTRLLLKDFWVSASFSRCLLKLQQPHIHKVFNIVQISETDSCLFKEYLTYFLGFKINADH